MHKLLDFSAGNITVNRGNCRRKFILTFSGRKKQGLHNGGSVTETLQLEIKKKEYEEKRKVYLHIGLQLKSGENEEKLDNDQCVNA